METEDELMLENFAATVVWQLKHPYELPVRWLCASKEHKEERKRLLEVVFHEWIVDESRAKQAREELDHQWLRKEEEINEQTEAGQYANSRNGRCY